MINIHVRNRSTCAVETIGRRHRPDNDSIKFQATQGYILCWISIFILSGGQFGSVKNESHKNWLKPPHGLSIPYVKNVMSINAFEFMRHNIHFSDNSNIKQKGVRGCDPLFKVSYLLQIIMKGMRGVWTSGKHVTIKESMIKYMVRAIIYVQYMPEKPTKYGIKVFYIFCDLSTIILGFKVYVGQEDNYDNTSLGICDELLKESGINSARGKMLYTNNY